MNAVLAHHSIAPRPAGNPGRRQPESRAALARTRIGQAQAALVDCHFCEHHCGVNRLAGERGLCKAGTRTRIFSAQVEVAGELELIPTFAIALSGCDLRCAFCITGEASWNPHTGEEFSAQALAEDASAALANGARSIMILGGEPTIHLPTVLEIVAALPDDATLVWKTNAHATAEARTLLDGLFDVWLADYKFGNDDCALRLARVPDYTRIVRDNLRWMAEGQKSELIVRHLLLPGHVECCWRPLAGWLAAELPGVKVSLRTEYWPAWQAARQRELGKSVPSAEVLKAREIAQSNQLQLVD